MIAILHMVANVSFLTYFLSIFLGLLKWKSITISEIAEARNE